MQDLASLGLYEFSLKVGVRAKGMFPRCRRMPEKVISRGADRETGAWAADGTSGHE
ncbi:hypothetical protein [Novacetimonas maltaceti]|uniref:hypothetical protein n=1 Tax=Novacetimonas maltaceti TaxID=1203393 RepID=UPI00142D50AA|nr:hypothetical protein [Novacetimonas maltaceti]